MTSAHGQIQLFAGTQGGPVRWRLLSGNNRELGRSVAGFATEPECRRAVSRTQSQLPVLTTALRRIDLHRWSWEIRHDGEPVVVSAHSFDRQVRCKLALAQFLDAFADAGIRPVLVVSGARRWARAAS